MYGKSVVNLFGGSFVNLLPIIYIGFSEASNFQPKKPFLNVKIRNMKRLYTLLLAGF
jgi:hypothetical protein